MSIIGCSPAFKEQVAISVVADVNVRMVTHRYYSSLVILESSFVVNSLSSLIHDTVFMLKGLRKALIASASDVFSRL